MNKNHEEENVDFLPLEDGANSFLHPLFGDHMVLQQGQKTRIWGWTKPGVGVSVVFAGFHETTVAEESGRWTIKFGDLSPGGPYKMDVFDDTGNARGLSDIYVGEVWLCSGQSNMDQRLAQGKFHWCGVENEIEEIAAANYPLIRHYSARVQLADAPCRFPASKKTQHPDPKCPPSHGRWTICSPITASEYSATAYFFARELLLYLKMPIGLIQSCYGASTAQAWISKDALNLNLLLRHFHQQYELSCKAYSPQEAFAKYKQQIENWTKTQNEHKNNNISLPRKLSKKPRLLPNPRLDQHSPSVMYNGMIAPLVPCAIRGVVWYHGESNQPTAHLYYEMLKTLITDWRSAWNADLSFLVIQLHNLNEHSAIPVSKNSIPLIREAQLQILKIKHTALVVSIDLGKSEFHLRNKKPLGTRLALAARNVAYGEPVAHLGPLFDRITVEGKRARVYFTHGEGLYSKGPLSAFVIAGQNQIFRWAHAEIDGNTVIVSHPLVAEPVAVRYAWAENPCATLYNRFDLPAAPFRSDGAVRELKTFSGDL